MISIGITGAGGGVGQAILRALRLGSLPARLVAMDATARSAGLYWADAAHLVPLACHRDAFVRRLLEIIGRESIDVLIPGLDPELMVVAEERARLEDAGCRVIVGSSAAVRLCRDKLAMSRYGEEHGLPFVSSLTMSEAHRGIETLVFPVIVKPRGGAASIGVQLVSGADELLRLPESAELIVQPYLPPVATEDAELALPNGRPPQIEEISAQFIVGAHGDILGAFVSENRLKEGVPIEVFPTAEPHYREQGLRIAENFAALGLRGPLNLQGRMTSAGIRFFEANARFTGITGVRTAMGFREVEAVLHSLVFGRDDEARLCLHPDLEQVGLRHVEDTVVPRLRIDGLEAAPTIASHRGKRPLRVLVTGASGYAGANLVARLAQEDEIAILAAVRTPSAADRLAELVPSRRLQIALGELPDTSWCVDPVDVVVHTAGARLGVEAAGRLLEVNAEGTRRLLEWARSAGVGRFIYLSSQAVYGHQPPPWTEALGARLATAYALSKWIGELLCTQGPSDALETIVLRVARLYGLGERLRWQELPHRFAVRAGHRLALPVHDGGRVQTDLLHVRDLCEAIVRACTLPLHGGRRAVLNIGSGRAISVVELAELCLRAAADLGLTGGRIEHRPSPVPSDAPTRFGMDIRRARVALDWRPAGSLRDGVRELIETAKHRPDLVVSD